MDKLITCLNYIIYNLFKLTVLCIGVFIMFNSVKFVNWLIPFASSEFSVWLIVFGAFTIYGIGFSIFVTDLFTWSYKHLYNSWMIL